MIIGVSGKIGSGKDTIGKIIQYLTSDNNDCTFDEWNKYNSAHSTSNWEIKKYAFKLKQIVALLTGCTVEDLENQEFKNQLLPEYWNYVMSGKNRPCNIEMFKDDEVFKGNPDRFIKKYTYRELLQKVGTESMRDLIHEDVWINALFADYNFKRDKFDESLGNNRSILTYPNWIITDCRFENEAKAIKDRDGILIRTQRNHQWLDVKDWKNHTGKKVPHVDEHPSETALDLYQFDYVIDNNSDIPSLVEKVKEILIKEKII